MAFSMSSFPRFRMPTFISSLRNWKEGGSKRVCAAVPGSTVAGLRQSATAEEAMRVLRDSVSPFGNFALQVTECIQKLKEGIRKQRGEMGSAEPGAGGRNVPAGLPSAPRTSVAPVATKSV